MKRQWNKLNERESDVRGIMNFLRHLLRVYISVFKYKIALEIIFTNEIHGNAHKCDNNNLKISASGCKCKLIMTHSQLRRARLILRLCLAVLKVYSQIIYLVKKDFAKGFFWAAETSRYLRAIKTVSRAMHIRVWVCFSFSSFTSFSFFLDVASATCPTILRSNDGGSCRRRLAVDPELPTALTKTPFSSYAPSISSHYSRTNGLIRIEYAVCEFAWSSPWIGKKIKAVLHL